MFEKRFGELERSLYEKGRGKAGTKSIADRFAELEKNLKNRLGELDKRFKGRFGLENRLRVMGERLGTLFGEAKTDRLTLGDRISKLFGDRATDYRNQLFEERGRSTRGLGDRLAIIEKAFPEDLRVLQKNVLDRIERAQIELNRSIAGSRGGPARTIISEIESLREALKGPRTCLLYTSPSPRD